MSNWKNPAPDASPVRAPTDSITTQVSPAGEAGDLIERLKQTARDFAESDPAPDMPAEKYIEWEAAARLAALQQKLDMTFEQRQEEYLKVLGEFVAKIEAAEALAASLQRRVETLTGALAHVHNWIANSSFNAGDMGEVQEIDDLVLTAIDWKPEPSRAALTPEQGGKP